MICYNRCGNFEIRGLIKFENYDAFGNFIFNQLYYLLQRYFCKYITLPADEMLFENSKFTLHQLPNNLVF